MALSASSPPDVLVLAIWTAPVLLLLMPHPPLFRPRAGRIEEEIRQLRSVELMGQKRKVDAHLRQLAKTFRRGLDPRVGTGIGASGR